MGWSRSSGTTVRGRILTGDDQVSAEAVDRIFRENNGLDGIASALSDLNGHYAIVHEDANGMFAAVDRVRSIPLFYGHGERGAFVSDDPLWVQERMGDPTMDDAAKREVLLTGYATGDRTLSPAVRQVRSGEIVRLSADGVARATYQEYLPQGTASGDTETRLVDLDLALHGAFKRAIDQAAGRTIVVPLSGGYDSRLVVLMLRKLGHDDVVGYTYGRRGSAEAEISRSLAAELGIRWEFVEYTNEKWFEWYRSPQYLEYANGASGLSSTPHLQDFPAVMELRRSGAVPEDSVFMPGHTVAIYVVPAVEGDMGRVDLAVDDVVKRHYNISGAPIDDPAVLAEVRDQVAAEIGDVSRYRDRTSAVEAWDFDNRQSKLIVNSVRVYEFFGYEWWLPLEDLELMTLWCSLPYELRKEKKLVKLYMDRLSNEMGVTVPVFHRPAGRAPGKGAASFLLRHKAIAWLLSIPYYRRRKRELYDEHPQAYFGAIPWKRYSKEFTGRESINFYHAQCFLERLASSWGRRDMAPRHQDRRLARDRPQGHGVAGVTSPARSADGERVRQSAEPEEETIAPSLVQQDGGV